MTNLLDLYITYVNDRDKYIRQHGINMNDIYGYLGKTGLTFNVNHATMIQDAAELYRKMGDSCTNELFDEFQGALDKMKRIEMAEWSN